ncbi:hypothetical protein ACGYLV_14630 [Sulfitobacter sp. M21595]|uniref:hypothetical protein n=1 Tax=Sulfitobacter sp. M21595 TaxID=3368574 RepID=UPI00374613BB
MSDAERLNIILTARDREFTRAMDRNNKLISSFASNANRGLSNTAKSFDKMGTAAKGSATGLGRVINMSGSGRFVLQNTAAQMGDIAVQMEMGTAASRVMSQQLPQLLGGFGALGGALGIVAPLLGTVAAVGIPLAAMLMTVGGEAEDSGEKVKVFGDYVADAEAALGRAEAAMATASAGGMDDLAEKYGTLTDKIRDLADALADIEMRAAQAAVGSVLDQALGEGFQAEVDKVFGTVGAAIVNAGSDAAQAEAAAMRESLAGLKTEMDMIALSGAAIPEALRAQFAEMQAELAAVEGRVADMGSLGSELGVSVETLQSLDALQEKLDLAREAGEFHGVADALSEIRTILQGAGDDIDQLVIDALVQAEDQARKMAKELGQADDTAVSLADNASQIAGGISPAVSEAIRLAEWLEISLKTAQVLAKLGPQGMPGDGPKQVGRGGDPRTMGGSFDDWRYREADAFLENWKPPKPSRGGRSGGSGGGRSRKTEAEKEAAKEATAATRQYESAVKALEKAFGDNEARAEGYREKLDALKAQFDGGKISAEEYSAGVDKIKDAFQESARQAKSLEDAAAQTFASIVTGSESASDALSNLFSNLANQLAQSAFSGLFSGSEVFAALGDLISGNFDGGGYTGNAPRAGGLDGKGGFLAMMHPKESVIDHTKSSGGTASGGGGGSVNIHVSVSGARGNSEISEMVQAGVRQGLQHYDRSVLPRSVKQINSDPRRIG